MYDLVYEQMDQAGVLEDLEDPVWMNLAGEIVSSEAESFGEGLVRSLNIITFCLLMIGTIQT
jgi:hypothetical protein